jgi:hypothetical protein
MASHIRFLVVVAVMLLIPTPALAVRGIDATEAPVETPRCVQRLRSLTSSHEKIEIQTEDGDRVAGTLRSVRDGLLLIAPRETEPKTELAIPLDSITGVAYWRHEEFQPDWIIAGLACGVMVGGLIGAMTGEDVYCDSFCDPPWLKGAAIGLPIGLGLGVVASFVVPKKHVIECTEAD